MTLHIAYDDRLLNWGLGKDHPTDPIRAKIAVDLLVRRGLDLKVHEISDPDIFRIMEVHDPQYVLRAVRGRNEEWSKDRPDLGETAALMFQGTADMVDLLTSDRARVAFAPQGAKHHAMYNYGSGFCVFNDFAWAARHLADLGETVLYIDLDAHHGDGVEALTRFDRRIMTASVHDGTIFPGTGHRDFPTDCVFNWALPKESGNAELALALEEIKICAEATDFVPTVILVAVGADGHEKDPLSSLMYTYRGYREAGEFVGRWARDLSAKVLMGGAGGYNPLTYTPACWATFVANVVEEMGE